MTNCKKEFQIVCIGPKGEGKSHLISCFRPKATTRVSRYEADVKSYKVTFYDTQGYSQDTEDIVSETKFFRNDPVDLILLCMKMNVGEDAATHDYSNTRRIFSLLNSASEVGEKIWANVIVVLTFANESKLSTQAYKSRKDCIINSLLDFVFHYRFPLLLYIQALVQAQDFSISK